MKRKKYEPLDWCSSMNQEYRKCVRDGVNPDMLLKAFEYPNGLSFKEMEIHYDEILSYLKIDISEDERLSELRDSDIFDALEAMAVVKKWSYSKQVFKLDEDFLRELVNTDEIFYEKDSWNYLPYKVFYLDFESCSFYQKEFNCQGAFVHVFTVDGNKTIIRLYRINKGLFIRTSSELDNQTDSLGFENLPVKQKEYRMENGKEIIVQSNLRKLMTAVTQILNYLSSVQPDIEESKETKRTYRKPATNTEPKDKFSEIQKWEVGVRFGAAFRKWKKEQDIEAESETDSDIDNEIVKKKCSKHVKVRPHYRKAHWSHFWYGSGNNKVRRAKWLSECLVGTKIEEMPVVIHRCEGE